MYIILMNSHVFSYRLTVTDRSLYHAYIQLDSDLVALLNERAQVSINIGIAKRAKFANVDDSGSGSEVDLLNDSYVHMMMLFCESHNLRF
jgi:hypothetical protein